jgi:hypothetical protein
MEESSFMRRGWRGVWMGAVFGAVAAVMLGRMFAGIDLATGGPGLSLIAGLAVGGFVGFFVAAILTADRAGRG